MRRKIISLTIIAFAIVFCFNCVQANNGAEQPAGTVNSIALSGNGASIKWEIDGYSAKGFKVVWSKNTHPLYPNRSGDKYHYFSQPETRSDQLEAFSGAGIYYVRVCEYLGEACGVYSNELMITLAVEEAIACTLEYAPVCGADNKTYGNECQLLAAGVAKKSYGECKKDKEMARMEASAEKLANNQFEEILKELKELRNLVKEQQSEIRHFKKLLAGVTAVSEAMQDSINNFIAYGIDDNSKRLGEGERAAVMYSYKSAFDKLPSNPEEFADVIKIANGRWPSAISEEALISAKANFRFIYKREAKMDDANDSAAITIMAYGLRQRSENRNIASEKNAIKTFKVLFSRVPETTEDWNILQAISYSGAKR